MPDMVMSKMIFKYHISLETNEFLLPNEETRIIKC